MGTFLGVPIIRIVVYWGLYCELPFETSILLGVLQGSIAPSYRIPYPKMSSK